MYLSGEAFKERSYGKSLDSSLCHKGRDYFFSFFPQFTSFPKDVNLFPEPIGWIANLEWIEYKI